jgi:hypothetical protein
MKGDSVVIRGVEADEVKTSEGTTSGGARALDPG